MALIDFGTGSATLNPNDPLEFTQKEMQHSARNPCMTSDTDTTCSTPMLPDESAGSSVSTRLMDEYDELMKYAVVVPNFNPQDMPRTLTDLRGTFPEAFNPLSDRLGGTTGTTGHVADDEGHDTDTTLDEADTDYRDTGTHDMAATGAGHVNYRTTNTQGHRDVMSGTERVRFANNVVSSAPATSQSTAVNIYGQQTSQTATGTFANTLFQEARAHVIDDAGSVQGSDAGTELSSVVSYSPNIDTDLSRMDGLMDTWLTDLKRNVLGEFSKSKIKQLEHAHRQMYKENQKHSSEKQQLYTEMENLKELLHTYEMSIERKDGIIANLTRGMQRQRDQQEMLKTFSEWKIRHNDAKREAFATNLAHRHYERTLAQKVWSGWHSLVEARWKSRVEKACQAKAAEVCMQLTNDYEAKLSSATEALEAARLEVSRLHAERETYEETMKKAFMRGVCALNMEAMGMFQQADAEAEQGDQSHQADHPEMQQQGYDIAPGSAHPSHFMASGSSGADVHPNAGQYPTVMSHAGTEDYTGDEHYVTSEAPGAPVTQRHAVRQTQQSTGRSTTMGNKASALRAKVINAKISARQGGAKQSGGVSNGLAPPMSSVVVQRHQPITKQTIGHATAMKYPQQQQRIVNKSHQSGVVSQRKIAGQVGQIPLVTPNISTVKVVE